MRNRKLLPFAVLLALGSTVLTACIEKTASNNVNPEAVYQKYSLVFSEEHSRFTATAEFNVGGALGTSLELVAPSTVKLDGFTLQKEDSFGVRYSRYWSAPADEKVRTWEWIDQNGKSYINSVRIERLNHFSRPSSLSLSNPVRFEIPGAKESDTGVHYELLIVQRLNEKSSRFTVRGVPSHNAVVFDLHSNEDVKASLRPGSATVRLSKHVETPLAQSTAAGGVIVSVYDSPRFTAKIEE